MNTVAKIMEEIGRLSPEERGELDALLHPRIDYEWDSPAEDVRQPAGKPAVIINEK